MNITLDMYTTVAIGIIVFFIGSIIKKHVSLFRKFCIPSPVIGGTLFAVVTLGLHQTGIADIVLDEVFQNLCMVLFFTSVGYTASIRTIKKAGMPVVILTLITVLLMVIQNFVGGIMAEAFGQPKLLGLCLGSMPLVGGHGNAGAFGPLLEEDMGIMGASAVAVAAATFGLIGGSLLGGPTADFLIRRYKLQPVVEKNMNKSENEDKVLNIHANTLISNSMVALLHIFISMALGSLINQVVKSIGLTLHVGVCSMFVSAILRNISDTTKTFKVYEEEGTIIGTLGLNIFLSLAIMSLNLWELVSLAVPMIVILLVQTVIMLLYAVFVTFPLMGKDFEAATMCSAIVGYGLGATPNAMANIDAVQEKYGPAPKSLFVIPIVGGLLTGIINPFVISLFINLFK